MIRVRLPPPLQHLADCGPEIDVEVFGTVTLHSVLNALEARYPMLRGTLREHDTLRRRSKVRFFAAGEDISLKPSDQALPTAVAEGREPLLIVGAIAGG